MISVRARELWPPSGARRLQRTGDAALMAMKQFSQIVHRQAVVMGYGDAFFMLTPFYFGLSLLVMLLNKPASASTEPAHQA
jgi:DHA2 family multidrug resistance protein